MAVVAQVQRVGAPHSYIARGRPMDPAPAARLGMARCPSERSWVVQVGSAPVPPQGAALKTAAPRSWSPPKVGARQAVVQPSAPMTRAVVPGSFQPTTVSPRSLQPAPQWAPEQGRPAQSHLPPAWAQCPVARQRVVPQCPPPPSQVAVLRAPQAAPSPQRLASQPALGSASVPAAAARSPAVPGVPAAVAVAAWGETPSRSAVAPSKPRRLQVTPPVARPPGSAAVPAGPPVALRVVPGARSVAPSAPLRVLAEEEAAAARAARARRAKAPEVAEAGKKRLGLGESCDWDPNVSLTSASTMLEPDVSGVIRPLSGRASLHNKDARASTATISSSRRLSSEADPLLTAQGRRNSMAGSEAMSSVSGIPSERGSPFDAVALGDRPSPGSGDEPLERCDEDWPSPADSQRTLSPSRQASRSWTSAVAKLASPGLQTSAARGPEAREEQTSPDSVATLSPPTQERKATAARGCAYRSLSEGCIDALRSVFGAGDLAGYPSAPHPNRPVIRQRSAPRPATATSPPRDRSPVAADFVWGLSPMTRNDPDESLAEPSTAQSAGRFSEYSPPQERISTSVTSLRTVAGTLSLSASSPASSLATISRAWVTDHAVCSFAASFEQRLGGVLAKDLFPTGLDASPPRPRGPDSRLDARAEEAAPARSPARQETPASAEEVAAPSPSPAKAREESPATASVPQECPRDDVAEAGVAEPGVADATEVAAQVPTPPPSPDPEEVAGVAEPLVEVEELAESPRAAPPTLPALPAGEAVIAAMLDAKVGPAEPAESSEVEQPEKFCSAIDFDIDEGSPASCGTVPEPASEDMIGQLAASVGEGPCADSLAAVVDETLLMSPVKALGSSGSLPVEAVKVSVPAAEAPRTPERAGCAETPRDDVRCYPCCIEGLGRLFAGGARGAAQAVSEAPALALAGGERAEKLLPMLLSSAAASPEKHSMHATAPPSVAGATAATEARCD